MKSITPELINSLTPIFIATIGGIIGVTVLLVPTDNDDDAKWSSAMGLAGTAIALCCWISAIWQKRIHC